jgi:hypothetical protein
MYGKDERLDNILVVDVSNWIGETGCFLHVTNFRVTNI